MVTECHVDVVDADVAPNHRARWKTSVHEAGHLVAGRRLLGCTTRAAVFDNACGVADLGSGNGVPTSFKEALATVAGPAAELLADMYAPPRVTMPVPLERAYPQIAGRLMAGVATMMSDEVAIARWCIQGREGEPDLWAKRHDWVLWAAREFVAEHRHEIVKTAAALFGSGMIRLPAQPEEGTAHVD